MLSRFRLLALLFAVSAPMSLPAQLFQQNQLITHPSSGPGVPDVSSVQFSLGLSYGYNAMNPTSLSDDFTVSGAIWNVTGFRFFAILPGSGTVSPFDTVYWRLWNGQPGTGATVAFGDLSTNRFSSTGFTGIYRRYDQDVTNTFWPIMYVDASASLALSPGTYWLEWSFGQRAVVPPITILGQGATGNGLQYSVGSGSWVSGVQGFPFEVLGTRGSVVPEPSTYVLLATGLLVTAYAARKRQARSRQPIQ